jgi:hypothetical protein
MTCSGHRGFLTMNWEAEDQDEYAEDERVTFRLTHPILRLSLILPWRHTYSRK